MSNEKDVSKELTDAVNKVLSRRDAVKKAGSIAAGAALAFLGLGMPGVAEKNAMACCGDCNVNCQGATSGPGGPCECSVCSSCLGECVGSCSGTCEGNCSGGAEW